MSIASDSSTSSLFRSPSQSIASNFGIAETPIRFMLALLAAIPCSFIIRKLVIAGAAAQTISMTIMVMGVLCAAYFCGTDIVYPCFSVFSTYTACLLCEVNIITRKTFTLFSWIFNFSFLMFGYWAFATDTYDISWTTCQSVLTLRMIGFANDFNDGSEAAATRKNEIANENDSKDNACCSSLRPKIENGNKNLSADCDKSGPRMCTVNPMAWTGDLSIFEIPSIASFMAFAFFPGAFLVGPQFSYRVFDDFINGKLITRGTNDKSIESIFKSSLSYALRTVFLGVFYIIASQLASIYLSSAITLTPWFLEAGFLKRFFFSWLIGKAVLFKYFGVWLLSEAACAISGLSYNGVTSDGRHTWDGMANIRPWMLETATSLITVVASFNVNTNYWAKLHLFKRLRWLGNKNLSAIGTLMFLSFWHGFHAGYFLAFSFEFVAMEAERRLKQLCKPYVERFSTTAVGKSVIAVACWLLTSSILFYATLGFDLLSGSSIATTFGSLYWYGHVLTLSVIGLHIIRAAMAPQKKNVMKKD